MDKIERMDSEFIAVLYHQRNQMPHLAIDDFVVVFAKYYV